MRFGFLRSVGSWCIRQWRETRPLSDIRRSAERWELLRREKIGQIDYEKSPTLRTVEYEATIEGLKGKGGSDVKKLAEALKRLEIEEAEALAGVKDKRTIDNIRRVFEAKRRTVMRGEL